jgi:hypothetical protein
VSVPADTEAKVCIPTAHTLKLPTGDSGEGAATVATTTTTTTTTTGEGAATVAAGERKALRLTLNGEEVTAVPSATAVAMDLASEQGYVCVAGLRSHWPKAEPRRLSLGFHVLVLEITY